MNYSWRSLARRFSRSKNSHASRAAKNTVPKNAARATKMIRLTMTNNTIGSVSIPPLSLSSLYVGDCEAE